MQSSLRERDGMCINQFFNRNMNLKLITQFSSQKNRLSLHQNVWLANMLMAIADLWWLKQQKLFDKESLTKIFFLCKLRYENSDYYWKKTNLLMSNGALFASK